MKATHRRLALFTFALLLSMPLSEALAVDYVIAATGTAYVVNHSTNSADTLTVSEPGAGSISFAAPGRTFTVNGGPITTGSSGSLSLSGIGGITINPADGGDTINVGGFTSSFPSLTINGGAGNDRANFTGNITFAAGKNLTVSLQSGGFNSGADAINVSNGAHLVASGSGAIDLECTQSVSITGGAVVQTQNGNLTVMANQQTTPTAGNFSGVYLDGAATRISVTSQGALTVKGRGGNDPGGYQIGVDVEDGAQIRGFGGLGGVVQVTGTGGASTGIVNRGVTIYGAGSTIAGTGDSMTIFGTAGMQGSGFGIGVSLLYGGQITGYNNVTPSVVGAGSGASGDSNQGVEMGGAASPASAITGNGEIDVTASAGPGSSVGLFMSDAAAIGPLPYAQVAADSISLNDTAFIRGTNTFYGIAITTISATHINLGGPDAPGTLGLTAAEVGQLITPRLTLAAGDSGNIGDVTISASITRTSATDVYLFPGSGGVHAPASGTDLNLAGGTLYLNSPGPLAMPITGPNADTSFPQLNVAGGVNLNGVALDLTGTTYAGSLNQTFTIVANDGTDAVTGTFQNLPEGALLTWPGSPLFYAQISYVGGSGNDVVLKLVNASANVTNNADSGPNSLRAAIAYAGAHSGSDAITFDPSLYGATIALASPIVINDSAGVTIDGRFLPGITISGNHATRAFEVTNGSNATLLSLNIANGSDTTGNGGGGILNDSGATLTVNNCTFTGNTTNFRGGAIRNNTGTLTVNQSTFAGNSSTDNGGAIASGGLATINQCTVSQNTATAPPNGGGGIYIGASTLTLRNSIVAGNTAPAGKPADLYNGAGFARQGANIIESASTGAASGPPAINADPLLAPLDNYDGPTLTMALEPGSPARDAAVGSTVTIDQRFYPVIGTPDIGAYEAGTLDLNYNAYIWETLPVGAAVAQHATTFDFDGDGVTNFNEFLAQTNPSDATSYPHITQFTTQSSGPTVTASTTFPTVLGRHYTLEFNTSPGNPAGWTPIETDTGTGNPITAMSDVTGITKIFIRLSVGP